MIVLDASALVELILHTPTGRLVAARIVYVALAEVLDGVLVTCDGPLSRAPAMAGRVELLQAKRGTR